MYDKVVRTVAGSLALAYIASHRNVDDDLEVAQPPDTFRDGCFHDRARVDPPYHTACEALEWASEHTLELPEGIEGMLEKEGTNLVRLPRSDPMQTHTSRLAAPCRV
jgi:hypothetical protein